MKSYKPTESLPHVIPRWFFCNYKCCIGHSISKDNTNIIFLFYSFGWITSPLLTLWRTSNSPFQVNWGSPLPFPHFTEDLEFSPFQVNWGGKGNARPITSYFLFWGFVFASGCLPRDFHLKKSDLIQNPDNFKKRGGIYTTTTETWSISQKYSIN